MMLYKKINNITGWILFAIASAVYIITSEPTASYWDCGEYISTAFKLQVGHPPGAPLFQMIGRFFSLFAFGNTALVARMVNTMSALASGFTILFLFWSVTRLAKKLVAGNGEMATEKIIAVIGSGIVGALAYTFSDSFWFSAVEGEVYAMSSFFTAFVFWAILKWEDVYDTREGLRWIILIAFMIGLSVGVHLLNLLALPSIVMVYYFKKHKPTIKGGIIAFVASIIILALIMFVLIPGLVSMAGSFERFFVNTFGLPFNSGTLIYGLTVTGLLIWGIRYTHQKGKVLWNTALLSLVFVIIGYSSFMMLVIRSNADTPINENNPTNAVGLLSYLNREQYGDWPLLTGPYYSAPATDRTDGPPLYARDDKQGKYVIIDERKGKVPVYDPRFTTFFPRMWSNSDPNHIKEYQHWANIKGIPIHMTGQDGSPQTLLKPTFGENLTFFWRYQVLHMYWRYFMWNFAGKQNDMQGLGNNVDGNWISGIKFIDAQRLGPQDSTFPENKINKGTNKFYFLPLILGLLGLVFHFKRKYQDWIIVMLLFIMTGIAIVVYLNQYAPQPRERDYAFAASFYAFAIWIGLGVLMVVEWLQKVLNAKTAAFLATGICTLLVPCVMAKDGWDDHDRSGRFAALASAKNFLESCDKDAILFTVGDNDTFPLWYAQEVEGVRRDVRVVCLSLLSGDWYINQMRKRAYESAPLPITLRPEQYRATNREVTYLVEQPNIQGYEDLKDIFDIIDNHEEKLQQSNEGEVYNFIPTKSFSVKVDTAYIKKSGMVPAYYKDSIVSALNFKVSQEMLMRSDLIVLDIIAHNNWKRPIYFSTAVPSEALQGLSEYVMQEGIAFRLVPVHTKGNEDHPGGVNAETMYHNMMDKFYWRNLNNPNVYLDETCRRLAMNYRNAFGRLATELTREGQNDKAVKALDFCMKTLPESQLPYDYFTLQLASAYANAGEGKKAADIWNRMISLSKQNIDYAMHSAVKKGEGMDGETQQNMYYLQKIVQDAGKSKQTETELKAKKIFEEYYNRLF